MKFKNLYLFNLNKNKLILFIIILLFTILSLQVCDRFVYAENFQQNEVEQELNYIVSDIVDDINFNDLENVISNLSFKGVFDGGLKNNITKILNGEYFTNYSSLFSAIFSMLIFDFKKILPFILTILAIGVLSNLMTEFNENNSNTSDIIHFVLLSVMVTIILVVFKDVLSVASTTFLSISRQIQIVFPILIALLTSIGSFSTISVYNPLVAVLSTIVSVVFEKLLYPLFIVIFIFTIIGSLTDTVKLNKLSGFISSSFKWLVGIVFTVFSGFLAVQGITAGKFDTVSIKATKFAVKSYIPIIGSYISDGMDFMVLGSVLVKNTIGLVGILILFLSVVSPIITILAIKLGLQLVSGILEMIGNLKMSSFVGNCSKILIYPIVLIIGVAFMYVITISLIMCTANIF